jgi:hypothetical protein
MVVSQVLLILRGSSQREISGFVKCINVVLKCFIGSVFIVSRDYGSLMGDFDWKHGFCAMDQKERCFLSCCIRSGSAVTQHTTACCSTQVVDITLMKLHSTNVTSLRVVQQKHCGSTHKLWLLQAQIQQLWGPLRFIEDTPLTHNLQYLFWNNWKYN